MAKRTHYRPATVQQRRHLFEVWEETGSVQEACRRARVSIRTFYYWKPRFDEGGYAALEIIRSHAPKNPSRIPSHIADQISEIREANPTWGKLRIANEVVRRNETISTISPNTVRRVLIDAGLWHTSEMSDTESSKAV